jgi:hypothetical protein
MRTTLTVLLGCGSALLTSTAFAGVDDVTPALRKQAEAVCQADALRLCADAIPDETAVVSCMRPKRALLTVPCRKIFDEVTREVRR